MRRFHLLAIVCSLSLPALAEPRTIPLADALRELEKNNPAAERAADRARQAQAVVRQVQSALLPGLVAYGGYLHNSDEAKVSMGEILSKLPIPPASRPEAPDLVIQPLNQFSASAALRVPLVVPNAWADVKTARANALAASESSGAALAQLRGALTRTAWLGATAEEMVAASMTALETAREHAVAEKRAVDAGTGTPLAVLRAEAECVRRESELLRARADLERAQLAAGVLMGTAEPVRVMAETPSIPTDFDLPTLLSEARNARPELRARALAVEAAQHDIDSAHLRIAPQLSASAAAFASSVELPTGEKTGWKATVDLSWQLYDGGWRYARRHQAEAALDEALAAQREQTLEIEREVVDATRDLRVARERQRMAEKQRELAQEAAASARRGFAAGTASSLDVLDANDRLFAADAALARERGALGAAWAALRHALGRP